MPVLNAFNFRFLIKIDCYKMSGKVIHMDSLKLFRLTLLVT